MGVCDFDGIETGIIELVFGVTESPPRFWLFFVSDRSGNKKHKKKGRKRVHAHTKELMQEKKKKRETKTAKKEINKLVPTEVSHCDDDKKKQELARWRKKDGYDRSNKISEFQMATLFGASLLSPLPELLLLLLVLLLLLELEWNSST